MSRDDKIELIKKHLGPDTEEWIINNCLKLLKDYDKKKKADRIELLSHVKPMSIQRDGKVTGREINPSQPQ